MCKCDYLCGIIITKGTLNASLLQDGGGEECHLLVLMLLFWEHLCFTWSKNMVIVAQSMQMAI